MKGDKEAEKFNCHQENITKFDSSSCARAEWWMEKKTERHEIMTS